MKESDFLHLPVHEWPRLCSEWDDDPIELIIKVNKAEKAGCQCLDEPFRAQCNYYPILKGFYVQRLAKYDLQKTN